MMRNLDSKESKDYFEKIDTLLTPDNIKRLARGPGAKPHIKALTHIEACFNSGSIDKVTAPLSGSTSRTIAKPWKRSCLS
ncbi:hypothetical protein VRB09_11235 [Pseudomonas poae]